MYRYLSLVWNATDPALTRVVESLAMRVRATLAEWTAVYKDPGMLILHCGEIANRMHAYKLGNGRGVILGKIFTREPPERALSGDIHFDVQESERIIRTGGRHIVESYWGRYVAFLNDAVTNTSYVLRDPTGGFPCFFVRYERVYIFFSNVEDCVALGLTRFSVNWTHVAVVMKFRQMQQADTGLREVAKLLPGKCVQRRLNGVSQHDYWRPGRVSQSDIIEDISEASAALYRTTIACVAAWCSCYRKIIHRLSGGLDSSIVLHCLKRAPAALSITCLNYFTAAPDGDERRYARVAAHRVAAPLIEREESPWSVRLSDLLELAMSAEPEFYLNGIGRCSFEAQLVRETGAEAIFTGEGGDGIFFQGPTNVAIDYVQLHGLGRRLPEAVWEAAHLCRASVWSVLCAALKDGLVNRPWNPDAKMQAPETSLMNRDILDSIRLTDVLRPWLSDLHEIPWGKADHIMMTRMPNYYSVLSKRSDFVEWVNPLLSQPLIELCLRIPTYVLTAGGRDRGLARLAFADKVAPEIIGREAKGGIDDYYDRVFQKNLKFIREFLLDGYLVREGLLDRRNLASALTGNLAQGQTERFTILLHMGTEAWVRKWKATRATW